MYAALADLVVVIHLAFIAFVVFGALLLLRWRKLVWVHLPALSWGVATEMFGLICPLTPLENFLRSRAESAGYSGGFIDNYLAALIYPQGLTADVQVVLGVVLLLVNVLTYTLVWRMRRGR